MDADSFVLSMNTKDNIRDLKKIGDIFDPINLDGNYGIFSDKNKKLIGKFRIETAKNYLDS